MRHYKSIIERISAMIKEYQTQPSANRVFILNSLPLSGKTSVAKEAAKRFEGEYIDLLKDKLSILDPQLGLYTPLDFKRDINKWSKGVALLVIDEIEALLDTWTRKQQEDFLKLLSRLGGRMPCPVLLTSRLDLPYEDFISKDKVFRIP